MGSGSGKYQVNPVLVNLVKNQHLNACLSKDEEERAFRRKNRKDPNPDRKGKAINVKTEETILERST